MTDPTLLHSCLDVTQQLSDANGWDLSEAEAERLAGEILPYLKEAPDQSRAVIAGLAIDHFRVDQMRTPGARRHDRFWQEQRDYFVKILVQKGLTGDAVEEIAQGTCLAAFRSLPSFRFKSRLDTFLHTILTRSIIHWYKKSKKLPQSGSLPDDDPTSEDDVVQPYTSTISTLAGEPHIVVILDCLERTLEEIGAKNEKILRVLDLYYDLQSQLEGIGGEIGAGSAPAPQTPGPPHERDVLASAPAGARRRLTDEAIAARLDEPPNTVRSWRARSLKQLKQCWE